MPFDAYSRYYDLLYRDKDYKGEIEYIDRLLQDHGVSGADILEFGSGTGIHGRLLAERGYHVSGIELSAKMVAQAEQTTGFVCRQGDICNVRLGRTFDVVLSLFHVISYQVSNESVKDVFLRASEHLLSGGLFIFDVWYSPAVHAQRPSIRVKRLEDDGIRLIRIAEPKLYPNENRVDVNYSIFVEDLETGGCQNLYECHPMRHFSIPELDLLAEYAGFERLVAEEFLTGHDPSSATWGLCVVLRKL